MRNIPQKSPGDEYFSDELNDQTSELKNFIQSTGQTLSAGDLFQVTKSTANYAAAGDFYNDTGIADAHVLSVIAPRKGPTAYVDGMRVRFVAANTNTGSATINVNALGIVQLVSGSGATLGAGQIIASMNIEAIYDGGKFRIVNNGMTPIVSPRFVGCNLTNDSTDPAKDIVFGKGFFRATNGIANFAVNSPFIKQLDAVWVAGSDVGGRASGVAFAASTWYTCFYLAKADGTVDCGFDEDVTPIKLLGDATGYIYYALKGSVHTDSSGDIDLFYNSGDEFWLDASVNQITAITGSEVQYTVGTPPGRITLGNFNAEISTTGGTVEVNMRSNVTPVGAASTQILSAGPTENNESTNNFQRLVDANSEVKINYTGSGSPAGIAINTQGWKELYDQIYDV